MEKRYLPRPKSSVGLSPSLVHSRPTEPEILKFTKGSEIAGSAKFTKGRRMYRLAARREALLVRGAGMDGRSFNAPVL